VPEIVTLVPLITKACPLFSVGPATVPTTAGQLALQLSEVNVESEPVAAAMFELVVEPTLTQTLSAFL